MNTDAKSYLSAHSLEAGGREAEQREVLSQRHQHHPSPRWLNYLGTHLLYFLTGQQTLSIRKHKSPDGKIQWIVYSPDKNVRKVFDTEQALRSWLEQAKSR